MHNKHLNKLKSILVDEDIIKIRKIYTGTSNETWFIKTKCNKYQYRITLSEININRNNEYKILKYLFKDDLIYYDEKYLLKKWIKGHHFIKIKRADIYKINKAIIKFSKNNISINTKINLLEFNHLLKDDLKNIYLKLVGSIDSNNFVLSHSDLTRKNILKNKNGIFFIDYEWSRMSYSWFDITYLLVNSFNSYKKWMEDFTSKKYLLICSIFCYSWCLSIDSKKTRKLKEKYYKWIYKLKKDVFI